MEQPNVTNCQVVVYRLTHWSTSSEGGGLLEMTVEFGSKCISKPFFLKFLSYPKRPKLSPRRTIPLGGKTSLPAGRQIKKVNVTFFLSHFLQAEVNDSCTQTEADQRDGSLALRKERRKHQQMLFWT